MELVPDIDRLTQIFSNAVAPSFFLGAIAAFVSLMMSRLAAVNAHIKATRALPDQDRSAVGSSMALRPLTRRARLLNDGIILSLGGGVCATLLLAALFASQFFGLKHVYGAGILFFGHVALGGCAVSVRTGSMACTPRTGGIAIKDCPRWKPSASQQLTSANGTKRTSQWRHLMSALWVPAQPVDATQALNLSAGVSNCKVSRGRSLS